MGKMNPVRVGSVPPEALKQGTLNETVSETVRRNPPTPEKLDDGPKRGELGEYLPAAYRTKSGAIRQDR